MKDKGKRPVMGWVNLKNPIGLIIALSGYTILLKIFEYLITIFLLLFALFFIYEPRKWYLHIVIAAIIANLSFFIFYKWLRVQLPTGIIRIW